ncbi:MAG: hypothetical protein H6627_09210 [Calditrichae bacterium]|nr:hypothetical protein [Calditrichia bacterium]
MRILILSVILITGLIMTGQENKDYTTDLVFSVDSIETVKQKYGTIILNTVSAVPDPCYTFSHVETKTESDTIHVKIFARRKKSETCIQIIGRLKAEFEVKPPKPGNYHFIFEGKLKTINRDFTIK